MGPQMLLGVVRFAGARSLSQSACDAARYPAPCRARAGASGAAGRYARCGSSPATRCPACRWRHRAGAWNSLSAAMNFSKSPAFANCCWRAIVALSSVENAASWLIASARTISSSTACRRKCACWARRTSIRLTTVAYCGNTSTRPSSSSRIKRIADRRRTDAELPASAARDSGDPGGRASEMIMPRRRSNTWGAA